MTKRTGAELIAAERQRQIEQEGYNAEHDDKHNLTFELANAASVYCRMATAGEKTRQAIIEKPHNYGWPWDVECFKPGDETAFSSRVEQLTKAGALIAAQIDSLKRIM